MGGKNRLSSGLMVAFLFLLSVSSRSPGIPRTRESRSAAAAGPTVIGNTFLGGLGYDGQGRLSIDSTGHVTVTGISDSSWGKPINPFYKPNDGFSDPFAAKLDPKGALVWNTFLWRPPTATGGGRENRNEGAVYLTGIAHSSWGNPVHPYSGFRDIFAAKVDSAGTLVWNTFLGELSEDLGIHTVADKAGNVLITGESQGSWGNPLRPYSGGRDAFVAKLDSNGSLLWNTFLGAGGDDSGKHIAIDGNGDIVLTGNSGRTWGDPKRPFTGSNDDAFVARLRADGTLLWSTFLGGESSETGWGAAVGDSGNIYVAGTGFSPWGTPVNPHNGSYSDAFVAKLRTDGTLLWHTFWGGSDYDYGEAVAVDGRENVLIAGSAFDRQADPLFHVSKAFVVKFDPAGASLWNAFLGGSGGHRGQSIVVGGEGIIYVGGTSDTSWGQPLTPHAGATDVFVAKISDSAAPPLPAIALDKSRLNFGVPWGGAAPPAIPVRLANSGGWTVSWMCSPQYGWITAIPGTGTGTGTINVGLNPSELSPGAYEGRLTVNAPGASNSPQALTVNVTVYGEGESRPPFGFLDTPADGAAGIEGSLAVTGWALDDVGIAALKIYRNPAAGEPPGAMVYIGDAVFVPGARPDVESAFPNFPSADRAGWGYMMLTNFLPNGGNGTFVIHAVATDIEGQSALLGSRTITCDNAHAVWPFGAIDTPAQGGTASGPGFINYGWALTPPPKSIPADGSTITAWVDGLPAGHPDYGHYRVDIATLFPGYMNANGAIGFIALDTTSYADGLHTIAWSATDTAGITGGIGSRYFNVLNGAAGASHASAGGLRPDAIRELDRTVADFGATVRLRKGYDPNGPVIRAHPDDRGIIRVEMTTEDRIEIRLGNGKSAWEGYLLYGGVPRDLPVGAAIAPGSHIFVWQPGPAFIGPYDFVFLRYEKGLPRKIALEVVISRSR